jgi:hypothetical protein
MLRIQQTEVELALPEKFAKNTFDPIDFFSAVSAALKHSTQRSQRAAEDRREPDSRVR